MSSKWRRFEVLLPLQYNDRRPVPPERLAEAVLEIVDHFGAATYETQKLEGHWRQGGVLYRDDLVRIVVDVPDSPENRDWMRAFKVKGRARLEKIELWMVSYQIDVGGNRLGRHDWSSCPGPMTVFAIVAEHSPAPSTGRNSWRFDP